MYAQLIFPNYNKFVFESSPSPMTEPASMKNEPFTDFPRQSYSFVTDDFCHDKAFVAKVTAKTPTSVIKLK